MRGERRGQNEMIGENFKKKWWEEERKSGQKREITEVVRGKKKSKWEKRKSSGLVIKNW